MNAQELIKKARDPYVSDTVIFEDLKRYLIDENLDLKEVENVGRVLGKIRPKVMAMLRKLVIEEHKDCCGDGACKEGDPK